MPVRDFDPRQGQAFQGDVAIIPIPDDIDFGTHEIPPVDGRLILQEGEQSGHHHAIDLYGRVALFRDDGLARGVPEGECPAPGCGAAAPMGTARFYWDNLAGREMQKRGLLTRDDLVIGWLRVTGGCVVLSHPEHDGIRIPPGNYLIGQQAERVAGRVRPIAD